MTVKRISAILPTELLPELENYLRECGVPGVTVEYVQGYGEHPNYFRRDLMRENVRVLLYASADDVDDYIGAIQHCAEQFGAQSGILVVEPIDMLVRLTGADKDEGRNGPQ